MFSLFSFLLCFGTFTKATPQQQQPTSTPNPFAEIQKVVLALENQVKTYPEDQYYKDLSPNLIPGPECLNDRIAVVGAGSGGVHMSLLLKERGFQNIKIFEKTNQIGGKSRSLHYRDTVFDMGFAYYGGGYEKLLQLLERFTDSEPIDIEASFVWNDTNVNSVPQNSRVYLLRLLAINNPGLTTQQLFSKLLADLIKYVRLHFSLFGISRGQLPARPKNFSQVKGTFLDYLKRNGLADLDGILTAAQTLQGYGQLDEIPALYGLIWNTPDLIIAFLRSFVNLDENRSYGILSKGYQVLWEEIVHQMNLKVIRNARVTHVHLPDTYIYDNKKQPIKVFFVKNGKVIVEEFDFIIWAIDAEKSVTMISGGNLQKEKHLFTGMTNSYLSVSLIDELGAKRSEAPENWYFGNVMSKKPNVVMIDRDTFGILNMFSGPTYANGSLPTGNDGCPKRTLVTLQFSNSPILPDASVVNSELDKHFTALGSKSFKVLDQIRWSYFPRFTQQQMEAGKLWDVINIQGQKGVWYIGGSTSFDSVKSEVDYNLFLVNRMKGVQRKCKYRKFAGRYLQSHKSRPYQYRGRYTSYIGRRNPNQYQKYRHTLVYKNGQRKGKIGINYRYGGHYSSRRFYRVYRKHH